jgi:RNA polymerase sigma-70 factor (sigma-E family)
MGWTQRNETFTRPGGVDPRGGRAGRLADLYVRHADAAGRLAYLLTGDRALAEDLVQEAFVRAARRLVHLRDPEAFPAYLRRTVVNLAMSHFRHRRVERTYLASQSAGEAVAESTEANLAEFARMRDVLLALPERQRAAIVLRFYEDLCDARIAELLRCREGTVRSLVSRGVAALRETLAKESEER